VELFFEKELINFNLDYQEVVFLSVFLSSDSLYF